MQATLSSRRTLMDAVAPKAKPAGLNGRGASEPSNGRDNFAQKLTQARDRTAEARDNSSRESADEDASRSDAAASSRSKTAHEPKKVDRGNSQDDAASDQPHDEAGTTAEGKPAAAVGPKKPDASNNAGDEVNADDADLEAKPVEATKPETTEADALAAMNVATTVQTVQQPTHEKPVAKAEEPSETIDVDATVVAAAVAARASPVGQEATANADAEGSEQAQAIDPAIAAKVAQTGDEQKADAQAVAAKGAASALTPQEAVAAAAEGVSKSHDHGSHDTGHQQPKQDDPTAGAKAASLPEAAPVEKKKAAAESTFDELLSKLAPQDATANKQTIDKPLATPVPTVPPEQKFAADNVDNVVKSVRTQLDAGGGQMRIRLDPPELGALDVAVKMVDGRMTASFTTSNEQATQLLSHSLSDLKHSLEASGITVDRIQVRQSSTESNAQHQHGEQKRDGQSGASDQPGSRGDQQRREAVEKMWRKLAYGSDELDFVA